MPGFVVGGTGADLIGPVEEDEASELLDNEELVDEATVVLGLQ